MEDGKYYVHRPVWDRYRRGEIDLEMLNGFLWEKHANVTLVNEKNWLEAIVTQDERGLVFHGIVEKTMDENVEDITAQVLDEVQHVLGKTRLSQQVADVQKHMNDLEAGDIPCTHKKYGLPCPKCYEAEFLRRKKEGHKGKPCSCSEPEVLYLKNTEGKDATPSDTCLDCGGDLLVPEVLVRMGFDDLMAFIQELFDRRQEERQVVFQKVLVFLEEYLPKAGVSGGTAVQLVQDLRKVILGKKELIHGGRKPEEMAAKGNLQ